MLKFMLISMMMSGKTITIKSIIVVRIYIILHEKDLQVERVSMVGLVAWNINMMDGLKLKTES